MHHFTSTPVPSTSTKCHTLSTALSLFPLSLLSPYNSVLCFPSFPPLLYPLDDRAELVFTPSSLSSLSLPSLLLCTFWGGRQATFHREAQAPFSDTSQCYTPPSSLYFSSLAHQCPPLHPHQCAASLPLLLPPFTLAVCPYPSSLFTLFTIMTADHLPSTRDPSLFICIHWTCVSIYLQYLSINLSIYLKNANKRSKDRDRKSPRKMETL